MKLLPWGITSYLAACTNWRGLQPLPSPASKVEASPTNAPDVFIVLTDDMGFADVGYHHPKGIEPPIPTPTLDKISSEGVRFNTFYGALSCTPARASLLTGLYPYNTGFNFALLGMNPFGLNPEHRLLPEALQDRGYQTKAVGKWHLGHSQDKHTPTRHGFDEFYGVYNGGLSSQFDTRLRDSHDMHHDMSDGTRRGIAAEPGERTHTTERFATKAIEFIEQADTKQPLFLYFAPTAAHSPLEAREQDLQKCRQHQHPDRQQYCGMVVGIDEAVKNITDAFAAHRDREMVLVFMSDNGGAPWQGARNYPFRGIKGSPYEGGVRVPAFIKAKTLPQGAEYAEMVHIADIAPTILRLVDETLQNDAANAALTTRGLGSGIDGRDLTDGIRSNTRVRDEVMVHHDVVTKHPNVFVNTTAFIKQIGADRWKLITGPSGDGTLYPEPDQWVLPNGTFLDRSTERLQRLAPLIDDESAFFTQEIVRELRSCVSDRVYGTSYGLPTICPPTTSAVKLFNLHDDPYEEHNVAAAHPDILEFLNTTAQRHLATKPVQKDWGRADRGFHPVTYPENPGKTFHGSWIPDAEDIETRPHDPFLRLELFRLGKKLFYVVGMAVLDGVAVSVAILYIKDRAMRQMR